MRCHGVSDSLSLEWQVEVLPVQRAVFKTRLMFFKTPHLAYYPRVAARTSWVFKADLGGSRPTVAAAAAEGAARPERGRRLR